MENRQRDKHACVHACTLTHIHMCPHKINLKIQFKTNPSAVICMLYNSRYHKEQLTIYLVWKISLSLMKNKIEISIKLI